MVSAGAAGHDRSWRVGVDVGGTFTDLAMVDGDGRLDVVKVPSVPSDPARAIMAVVEAAAAGAGLGLREFLRRVELFVHGSTVATNTVLEGNGARTGLIVTAGFRDFLEIRRGQRANPWDHRTPYPAPIVPRYLRLPIRGRIDCDGREVEPLCLEDVSAAAETFRREGVEAVALCLMNSFLDPSHEVRAAALVRQVLDGAFVSPSGVVAPDMGEYERGSTAVLNAYVAPRTVGYLTRLRDELTAHGLVGPLLLIQNNGGAASVAEIADRPLTLLLSGPAAGVGALAHFARALGTDDLVSMEIGGTSCDVMLMAGGEVAFTDRLDIAGHVCVSPSVEIHTIGAGGGTIASVDEAGLLRVGPRGAGARPGPACFGLGGTLPTITDAQVVLGRLKPGPYVGGSVRISGELAAEAISRGIAVPLGIGVEEAAIGMIRLMEQKLLQAVQTLSTERGHDPRGFTLVGCGGAGPLHAAAIGRALGCRSVYLPRASGAFCAIGMLNSSIRHDAWRPYFGELDGLDPGDLARALQDLERTVVEKLGREGFGPDRVAASYGLDLRYVGQQWDVTTAISPDLATATIRQRFETEHERLFGHHQPDGIVQVTKVRVVGIGRLPRLRLSEPDPGLDETHRADTRRVWIDPQSGWRETRILAGASLRPGQRVAGPLIVDEETTTILVGTNDSLEVDRAGNYVVTFEGVA